MGLERGNRSSKQKINNCSIEKKSKHNADKVTDKSPNRNSSNLDTDHEGDNDLEASSSLKHSSFNSSLSKLPSSDSSSSPTSSSQDEVLQDNKIKEGFNARKGSTLPVLKNDENGVSRNKSAISIESETGSLESLTFPIADVTNQSYQPHLTSIMQSPPMQVMDKAGGGYDPFRIPSAVFERNKSTTRVEWSLASNESLFSLKLGSASCSRDRIPLSEIKPGDQVVLSPSISVADRDNQPSVPTEGTSKQPIEMKKKKKKSNEISGTNEVVVHKSKTTTIYEIKEIDGDEDDEDNHDHNDDNDGVKKNEKHEENKTTSTISWNSATISKKPDARGISKKSDASEISKKSYTKGYSARKKKNKCACSSFYCSNCSLAFCYCKSPIHCCNWNCASCYCSNCTWVFCYCWNCTKKKWCLCGCCQPSTILPDGVKSGSPKVIAGEQPSSACETSAKSTSCNWWYCFSCCSWDIFSCRSCSCSSCRPCSCFSCRPCRFSFSCWPSSCFSSCRSCSCFSCCSSITCSSCCSCSISSCWPSSCCSSSCHHCSCCSSCHPCSCCSSCHPCSSCSSGHKCSFSCSSCCPCSSISCRPCCCSSCPPWSCSCHPWRCSCRQGRCCCCGGTDNYCSCQRVADKN